MLCHFALLLLPSSSTLFGTSSGTKGDAYFKPGAPMPLRWKSSATFLDYPWIAVAIGPDPASNELRGHARGIIAIGDMATGIIALGGIARGLVALGGLAIGGVTKIGRSS